MTRTNGDVWVLIYVNPATLLGEFHCFTLIFFSSVGNVSLTLTSALPRPSTSSFWATDTFDPESRARRPRQTSDISGAATADYCTRLEASGCPQIVVGLFLRASCMPQNAIKLGNS